MIGCAFAGMGMIGGGSDWRPDSSCRSVGRAGARPSQGPSARTTVSTKLASGIVEHQLDSFSLQVTPPPPGFIAAGVVTGVTVGRAGARPSQGPSARTTVSTKLASGIVEHQLDSFPCKSLRHRRVSRGQRSVRRYRWSRQNSTRPATRLPLPPPPAHWQNTR